jgi:Mn-dependent DtxR family transcriptional regulator
MKEEKIVFLTEDGEEAAFFVLEETRLGGNTYLLVADSEEEEANALLLKEVPGENPEETVYDVVENEQELAALSKVFEELLEDIEIEME